MTDEEHLIRKTGNYLSDSEVPLQHADMHLNYRSSTTSFGVTINLETPVLSLAEGDAERTGPPSEVIYRPFTRAVYTFEYGNVELLQALNKAIAAVNEEALKDTMIGSLMSYEFSEEEIAAANDATLNVIGGFMVLDDDSRMVFIEGTAEGMNRVLEAVPRSQANDWSFRVLSNPDVRFKDRLYTSFNVDLKKVRFRDPLPFLNAMPEIYNRAKVSEECFEALHRLGEIRHGNRLSEASMLQMFPTAGMITSIESKYGESISLEDILGVKPKKKIRSWEVVDEQVVEEEVQVVEEKKGPPVRNGPTDDKNPEFDKYLKTRKAPDYIGEQTVLLKEAQEDADRRRVKREEEDALEDPNRHTYSTQKLAYTEIKKAQMRDRLRKEKNCTFTYSKDYTSQTISMVDAERLSQVSHIPHTIQSPPTCPSTPSNASNTGSVGGLQEAGDDEGRVHVSGASEAGKLRRPPEQAEREPDRHSWRGVGGERDASGGRQENIRVQGGAEGLQHRSEQRQDDLRGLRSAEL